MKFVLLFLAIAASATVVAETTQPKDPEPTFLRDYMHTIDMKNIRSGWLKYRYSGPAGDKQTVELIFRNPLYSRTLSTNANRTCNHEWYDGQRYVRLSDLGTNSTVNIQTISGPLRDAAFIVFRQIFNFWDDPDRIYGQLKYVSQSQQGINTEYVYSDPRNGRTLKFVTTQVDKKTLPIKITLLDTNGTVLATWDYEGWELKSGGIWFPEHAIITQTGSGTQTTFECFVDKAQFNIPVQEVWFIPRIPNGVSVYDQISDPDALLMTPNFNPLNGFSPPGNRVAYQPDSPANVKASGTIGILLEERAAGPFTIESVLVEGPAYNAGIRKGDRVVKVDGRSTAGMSLNEFVSLVRGVPETVVKLDIEVRSTGAEKSLSLSRR